MTERIRIDWESDDTHKNLYGDLLDLDKEIEDWAGAGVAELEALLAKHAEFLNFLDVQEQSPGQLEEIKVEKVASLGHLVTQETITDIEALEE
jgi:hypothetical protein